MTRYAMLLSVTLLTCSTANANTFAYLYDIRQLQQEKPRYEQRIGELYKLLRSQLNEQELRSLAGVRIEVPLIGAQAGTPVDFYTMGQAGRASIFMPVLSLLFLDDLATVYAWLERHDYSLDTIEEYIAMLRAKKPSDFPEMRYPPPLKAFHIPPNAVSNDTVKSLALSLRDEAYSFIMLHELGRILYRSLGDNGVSKELTRSYEAAADRFALTVLERAQAIPMGMILWFMAQMNAIPNRDLLLAREAVKSNGDRQRGLKIWAIHPLTVDRLSRIVSHLHAWGERIGSGNRHDLLTLIAERLASMADSLGNPELQGCMAVAASRAHPTTLMPRRIGIVASSRLMQTYCESR